MDRGRAGGFITDNNYAMVKFNEKKRKEHLRRLNKIKTRKPGSSATLDNNPPVIIHAMLNNPRKVAVKDSFNFITERENKALLKRITTILVAPPAITDQSYKDMKKLVASTTKGIGGKSLFEEKIVEKKNKEFFDNLKKTKPYYNASAWEDDYKKQLFNQKFMRQVKYRRPPNYIDPLTPTTNEADAKGSPNSRVLKSKEGTAESKDDDSKQHSFSSHRQKPTASHVDRIRAIKSKGHSNHNNNSGGSRPARNKKSTHGHHGHANHTDKGNGDADDETQDYENDEEFLNDEDGDHHNNITIQVFQGDSEYEHDSFFNEGEGSLISTESRLPLAGMDRSVKVTREVEGYYESSSGAHQQEDFNSRIAGEVVGEGKKVEDRPTNANINVSFVDSKIECSVINREYLVLSVVGMDGSKLLQAEAEINRVDLNMFGDFPMDRALDPSALNDLAQQMVENVELRIDTDGQCRVMLSLLNENEDGDSKYGSSVNNDWDYQNFSSQPLACASEEELQQMLLPDRNVHVLTCGVKVPVTFIVHPGMQGIGNILALIDMAKKSNRVEYIYALVKIYGTNDDQLAVKAIFTNNTKSTFKKGSRTRPAITTGTVLTMTTPLPSIVQADPDMILSFAENLSKNIKAEHDCKSGENVLVTAL